MDNWLERVRIVLCRPEGALNVGAVCRAMMSMGLSNLYLVSPALFDESEVFKMAIHAREIYENAVFTDSLETALSDTALSAGITRRQGVKRKWFSILPEELAEQSASMESGITALVFGNERSGLEEKELNCCNISCRIPASPDFPSLNLSHAVQIITSAFYRKSLGENHGLYHPVSRQELDSLVQVIHDSLDAMNYFKAADRFKTDRYFRDILARSALSLREARQMEKVFRKLQYLRS